MTDAALTRSEAIGAAPAGLSLRRMQSAALWLFIACGAVASVEPSPYEIGFVVALLAFGLRGLCFDRGQIPMILGLGLYNAGGLIALVPFVDQRESVVFVAISVYIALTAVFFAALIAQSPLDRMRTIRSGYVAAGCVAATFAVLGYFDVAGLAEHFTLYGRASGTFKDPNVLGSFLTPPIVWLTQDILLRRGGALKSLFPLLLMLAALFLSFSRGSWAVWVASELLMVALTFLTTGSAALRARVVALTIAGLALVAILLVVALSDPAIRSVFEVRASLSQDYDLGELGRFGAQARSLPMLLDLPFGFGPLQYRNHFYGVDPHDVYINAFASYGWLGGLGFAALTAATLYCGWRLVFRPTPLRTQAIAVWSCLFVQILQGLQIDTDHWRHLFLLMGALFGLVAAARRFEAARGADQRRASV
jgi:hypothetical protein